MPKRVFVSYAQQDHDKIQNVLQELSSRGVLSRDEAIFDPVGSMKYRTSIRGVIREKIQSASKVILLWTEAGAKSLWVNYEVGMAEALGKPIIVVLPEKSVPNLPGHLTDLQIVRLSESA